MKNKVLIELVVPDLEEKYDVYIPINKRVGNITILLAKTIDDLSGGYYKDYDNVGLYSGVTGERYAIDMLIRDSDIRNGSRIILM